jgi:hypothetical protein
VFQSNFTSVADKVHRLLMLNHTMQGNESATTIKFAGDPDDDANIGVKMCLSQAKQKL